MENIKTVCIVLNYNDAPTAIKLVRKIQKYKAFDKIIIVDNASTDDSREKLGMLAGTNTMFLRSKRNGGYGSGNNIGLKHAYEVLHAKYAVIANPDIDFCDEDVIYMSRIMDANSDLAVISPMMKEKGGFGTAPAWPLRDWFHELCAAGPLMRRLFKKLLNYPASYYKKTLYNNYDKKNLVYVDAVPGAFLMVRLDIINALGGYDEKMFLYGEENLLAYKIKNAGARSAVITDRFYIHNCSSSIKKLFSSLHNRQKLREISTLYYFKKYLRINPIEYACAVIFFKITALETLIGEKILKIKK
ncbi:hypothetical protein HMPREF9333_01180 [Johnsonella ignava ATCC 51276]|jgi:hypothetical protein|uniref:Glycosyltransferase 2-like domain-containing protein n=1 Tax=Johnsonella ignava ATCC 51276 TaxID=679200 RepID=G5GHZ0_9FIRM|nr:glycosyltransferase family 2 protein [Johnsonella ignava]EHI55465.1 hypothetical protein HMPREF9333_01180 [Johnsonella ignava ATCC 51276]